MHRNSEQLPHLLEQKSMRLAVGAVQVGVVLVTVASERVLCGNKRKKQQITNGKPSKSKREKLIGRCLCSAPVV